MLHKHHNRVFAGFVPENHFRIFGSCGFVGYRDRAERSRGDRANTAIRRAYDTLGIRSAGCRVGSLPCNAETLPRDVCGELAGGAWLRTQCIGGRPERALGVSVVPNLGRGNHHSRPAKLDCVRPRCSQTLSATPLGIRRRRNFASAIDSGSDRTVCRNGGRKRERAQCAVDARRHVARARATRMSSIVENRTPWRISRRGSPFAWSPRHSAHTRLLRLLIEPDRDRRVSRTSGRRVYVAPGMARRIARTASTCACVEHHLRKRLNKTDSVDLCAAQNLCCNRRKA